MQRYAQQFPLDGAWEGGLFSSSKHSSSNHEILYCHRHLQICHGKQTRSGSRWKESHRWYQLAPSGKGGLTLQCPTAPLHHSFFMENRLSAYFLKCFRAGCLSAHPPTPEPTSICLENTSIGLENTWSQQRCHIMWALEQVVATAECKSTLSPLELALLHDNTKCLPVVW